MSKRQQGPLPNFATRNPQQKTPQHAAEFFNAGGGFDLYPVLSVMRFGFRAIPSSENIQRGGPENC